MCVGRGEWLPAVDKSKISKLKCAYSASLFAAVSGEAMSQLLQLQHKFWMKMTLPFKFLFYPCRRRLAKTLPQWPHTDLRNGRWYSTVQRSKSQVWNSECRCTRDLIFKNPGRQNLQERNKIQPPQCQAQQTPKPFRLPSWVTWQNFTMDQVWQEPLKEFYQSGARSTTCGLLFPTA